MADESMFEVSATPTIYYFVDKDTNEVAGIHMYSIFGMSNMDRDIKDWKPANREDEAFVDLVNGNYDIYKYDWSSEPYSLSDMDPEDVNDWYPKTAVAWGNGETVTVEDLAPFAKKLEEVYFDAEELEDVPGDN